MTQSTLPQVAQTPPARWRDAPRVMVWVVRGYLYGARHAGSARSRLYAAGLAVVLLTLFLAVPLVVGLFCARLLGVVLTPGSVVGMVLSMYATAAVAGPYAFLFALGHTTYMTQARDAVLVLSDEGDHWRVRNFFAARPRTRAAVPIWEHTIPALEEAADRLGVTVKVTAMNEELAREYRKRISRLDVVRTRRTGQVEMRRLAAVGA